MKTLYLTQSSDNIVVDPDTNYVGKLYQEDRYSIRSVYYIEEPMHVVYQHGEEKEEIDARKGDILLVFYSDRYNKYHLDTIRTKQWAANIKNRHAIEQKDKEEWAQSKKCDECCDCDKCCGCNDLTAAPEPVQPASEAPAKKKGVISKLKNMLKKNK